MDQHPPTTSQAKDHDALEKLINEMLQGEEPLHHILDHLLLWVEKESKWNFIASILLFNPDTHQLFHGSAPSLPEHYCQAVNGILAAPSAGSCGTAAFRKQQVIVEDIDTDPLWQYYKSLALPVGLRACWSTPLLTKDNDLLGTFAIYYKQPRKPDEYDLQLIHKISRIATEVIEKKKEDLVNMIAISV